MMDDPSKTRQLPDGPAGELPIGAELSGGMYRITARIAAGGFGITYEARDNLDRKVAIKECFPAGLALRAGDFTVSAASSSTAEPFETARNLFLREARTLANLRHPNIVHVQTLFEENGTAYMAMDYIEGRDLQDVIDHAPDELTPARIMELTRALLGALDYLHRDVPEKGKTRLLHRDIKPANIRIDPLDNPVIIDFGAARQESKARSRAAGTFRVVSDGYSPNEFYVAGTDQGPASDLYSLAATLYHAITGSAPAPADERAQKVSNGDDDPYQPISGRFPDHDPRLLALIDRAMSRPIKDRPVDAAAWFAAIPEAATRIVETPPPAPVAVAAAVPPPAASGSSFWKGAAAGGLLLALLGGGIVAFAPGLIPGGTSNPEELRRQLAEAEAQMAAMNSELEALQSQVGSASDARATAQTRVTDLETEIAGLREQLTAAGDGDEAATEALRLQLERAVEERGNAAREVQDLEAELATFRTELETALAEAAADDDAEMEALRAERAEAMAARDEALARAADLESDLASLQERVEELTTGAANSPATSAMAIERDAAIAARDAALAARDTAREQAERAQADIARLQEEADRANGQLAEMSAEILRLGQELAAAESASVTPNPGPNIPVTPAGNCPTWEFEGPTLTLTGEELYSPDSYSTVAGGAALLSDCPGLPANVTGFAATTPNFTLYLSDVADYRRLELQVTSTCDTTLLVNTQDTQWHFDDDSNGNLTPLLNLVGSAAIDGRIDIWVGTYNGDSCPATVEFETWFN